MMKSENAPQLALLLPQTASNPQTVIDQIRPLADSGDLVAAALLAYLLGPLTGRWPEGIRYAQESADAGITSPAYIYGQNLMGQPDAALRQQAARLMETAMNDGWPIDPLSAVMQSAQHGDTAMAEQLLDVATSSRPAEARRRWQEVLDEVMAGKDEVMRTAGAVNAERDRVLGAMREDSSAVQRARENVEELATQVGVLANKTAGGAIAEDYARRAASVERTARYYTLSSIALAVLIAVGAVIATVVINEGEVVGDAASKAAIAVPLVALNLYLGRLAAQYRQEAVALRHIELQFNTANPFRSALDEERREDVLVQLAQKFSPASPCRAGEARQVANPTLVR